MVLSPCASVSSSVVLPRPLPAKCFPAGALPLPKPSSCWDSEISVLLHSLVTTQGPKDSSDTLWSLGTSLIGQTDCVSHPQPTTMSARHGNRHLALTIPYPFFRGWNYILSPHHYYYYSSHLVHPLIKYGYAHFRDKKNASLVTCPQSHKWLVTELELDPRGWYNFCCRGETKPALERGEGSGKLWLSYVLLKSIRKGLSPVAPLRSSRWVWLTWAI